MFNFDSLLFMDKVREQGIEISQYGNNAFTLPNLIKELPDLNVACFYIQNNNTMGVSASVRISEIARSNIVSGVCNTINSVARFYTGIQEDFVVSSMSMDFSKLSYNNDDEALEHAVSFVLLLKQELYKPGVINGLKYINTGNINCLSY